MTACHFSTIVRCSADEAYDDAHADSDKPEADSDGPEAGAHHKAEAYSDEPKDEVKTARKKRTPYLRNVPNEAKTKEGGATEAEESDEEDAVNRDFLCLYSASLWLFVLFSRYSSR